MKRWLFMFILGALAIPLHSEPLHLTTLTDLTIPFYARQADLVKAAFQDIGLEAILETVPAQRGLEDADRGFTDGESNRIAGLEVQYPNLIMVPESLEPIGFCAFTTQKLKITSIQDIVAQKLSVATRKGYKFAQTRVQPQIDPSRYIETDTIEQALGMLTLGRVDVVVYSEPTIIALLTDPRFAGISKAAVLDTQFTYLYLNKKWASVVPKLAASLKKQKAK